MSSSPPPAPAPDTGPAVADASRLPRDEARLEHLFRRTLRDGRIHPLQHLVRRHRTEADE